MNRVERGHQMYREGRYTEALAVYSDALSLAKSTPHMIALHSNRAACFLKLYLFQQAADECTAVLELDSNHTGALLLRAQTLVTLKDYQSALFDVNRLLDLNPSSEVYLNLQARLKTQLSLAPIPEVESELEEDEGNTEEEDNIIDDMLKMYEDREDQEGIQQENNSEAGKVEKPEPYIETPNEFSTSEANSDQKSSNPPPKAWQTIPKPKGHSRLDYSRWDSVEDDSSEEDEENNEETQPQYRFRLKNVDLRPVK